mgnify:FL=1
MIKPQTQRECIRCTRLFPLQKFRRWRGKRTSLTHVCHQCDPPLRITAHRSLNSIQLNNLVEYGRANPLVVKHIKAKRRAKQYYDSAPRKALARRKRERLINWAPIIETMKSEYDFARRKLNTKSGQPDPFYSAYYASLTRILAEIKLQTTLPGSKMKPTPDQLNPTYWFSETEFTHLRLIYSQTHAHIKPNRRTRYPVIFKEEKDG